MDFDPRTESPGDPTEDDAWTIDSLAKLTWAMKILRDLDLERREIETVAAQEITNITTWKDRRLSALTAKGGRLAAMAAAYTLSQRRAGKPGTQSTPYGTVRATKTQPKVVVEDREALLAYIRDNGLYGWCSLSPLTGTIKDAVEIVDGVVYSTSSGVEVPGVRHVPSDFSISFNYTADEPPQED